VVGSSIRGRRCALQHMYESRVRPLESELPLDWIPHQLPNEPVEFVGPGFVLPVHTTRLLQRLNAHKRDIRIRFDEGPHIYYVDGCATAWSVTGLVHKFCSEFDPGEATAMMRRGRNWPRSQYVTKDRSVWRDGATSLVVATIEALPAAGVQTLPSWTNQVDVLSRGAFGDLDLDAMTDAVRQLSRGRLAPNIVSDAALAMGRAVADSDETILTKWDLNRDEAANRGTWMHLQCELWANRDECHLHGPEGSMFMRYVRENLEPLGVRAYRTEWEVYGVPEDLAGSIDFVGRIDKPGDPDHGKIVIVDWKRSRQLRFQDKHAIGKTMRAPLDRLPDSAKWHYALQLNCYAYLLETYYGVEVAWMEVACFHPDNEGNPYAFRAPRFPDMTAYMMAWQRSQVADRVLERAKVHLERDLGNLPDVL
jgi:hypothetical protein